MPRHAHFEAPSSVLLRRGWIRHLFQFKNVRRGQNRYPGYGKTNILDWRVMIDIADRNAHRTEAVLNRPEVAPSVLADNQEATASEKDALSLESADSRIWRIRSRETPNLSPRASSVFGVSDT